jgi:hypothetical protein
VKVTDLLLVVLLMAARPEFLCARPTFSRLLIDVDRDKAA